jgi:hypothetical protein
MGAVYESADLSGVPGMRWAVKEISPAALPASERTQAIADFRREAQMLATLQHPNLPTVVETFEEMGKHFLVMEFIPGRTLLNLLDSTQDFLPEERVLVWAWQLLDVLHYLHSQDPPIIYRDLKPSNVMLVESTERIKLIDFGIARFHKAGKTRDTEAFGTAGYAPPEQYGKGQTDQRSDVYALAATLHHLLTKHDPSHNPFTWLPVRRYNPAVSVRLESALQRALNLDPAKRFQTVREFAEALGFVVSDYQRQTSPVLSPTQVPQQAEPARPMPVAPAAAGSNGATPKPSSKKKSEPKRDVGVAPVAAAAGAVGPTAMPAMASAASVVPATPAGPATPVPPATSAGPPASEVTTLGGGAHPIAGAGVAATKQRTPADESAPYVQRGAEAAEPAVVVSDRLVDLGEVRWNSKPVRRISIRSQGDRPATGMVVVTQPWIACNPLRFQGRVVNLEVRVRRNKLHFGRVELQVPNLFAIIWSRLRRVLPFIGFWFWLLLLAASSLGRWLIWGVIGTVGALLLLEGLMWLWAWHVRTLVPADRLNTGRIVLKSQAGDQHIEVRAVARPSWARKALGWATALLLFTIEVSVGIWIVLALAGIDVPTFLPTL